MKRSFAFISIFLLLTAGILLAQKTTGQIEGVVHDPDMAPLPGVAVTVTGPTTRSMVTGSRGEFRFPALPPGTYSVSARLAGFKTETETGIVLALEGNRKVDFTMQVGQLEEEITVVGVSPIVDLTSSRLSTNVSRDFFDALPKGRSYQDMIQLAPSVISDPWGAGMSGSTGAENQYIIDGVNTTDVEDGLAGTNLTYEFIEEVQVKTGGYEPEFGGALGGVVNIITKSGSNQFHGGLVFNYQSQAFYGTPKIGIFGAGAIGKFNYYDFGLNFSGPLIKDKLWFFVGGTPSFRKTYFDQTNSWTEETQSFLDPSKTYYFSAKLTFEPAAGHKITLSGFGDPLKEEANNPGTLRDFASWNAVGGLNTTGGTYNGAFKYDGLFGNDWILHILGGMYYDKTITVPKDVDAVEYILEQGYLGAPQAYVYGGSGWYCDPYLKKRLQANGDITKFMGGHSFKAGVQWNRASSLREDAYTGGYYRQIRPTSGYFRDRHRVTHGTSYTDLLGVFLQDSWKVFDRLNINFGVRLEDQNVHASDESRFFTPSESIIHFKLWEQISPRLGFTYDILGNGTSKLFGSFGRFFEMMPLDLNNRQFGGEVDIQYYYHFDVGDPLTVDPDTSLAYRIYEAGSSASSFPEPDKANKGLKGQYSQEVILGFENQFATNLSVSIRGVWKTLGMVIEDGSFDGGSSYFLFNPGRQFTVGEINPNTELPRVLYVDGFPKAKRDYKALEILLNKRYSHNYMFTASYTFSRLRGNHPGLAWEEYGQLDPNITALFDFPEFLYNADGILPGDRPHQLKLDGVYQFSKFLKGLSIGASFRANSGHSLSKIGYNEYYGFCVTLTPRGADGRLPMFHQLDLHVGYDLHFAKKYKVGITADIFNVYNSRIETTRDMRYLRNTYFGTPSSLMPWDFNTTAYPTADNSYYGHATNYQAPIRARLGLMLSF
jgi:hypothetical protein